jgi:translation initiation factor 1
MDICPKCGLPIQACVCEEIAKSDQNIEVKIEKKKFGKISTIVTGLKDVDIKDIAKKLKEKLACGGTIKNNEVELQGDHRNKIRQALVEIGFESNKIKI